MSLRRRTLSATLMAVLSSGIAIDPALAAPPARPIADWSTAGGPLFVRALGPDALAGTPGEGNGPPGAGVGTPTAPGPAGPDTPTGAPPGPRLGELNQPFMALIGAAAERHGLDPKLLHAVIAIESAYRPGVCSQAGACGLAQLMPATAAELGVTDRFDPAQNVAGGADYLARQILRFADLSLALAAYNSGPGRVARLGRVPDIAETRGYVRSVIACYLALSAGRTIRTARDCPAGDAP